MSALLAAKRIQSMQIATSDIFSGTHGYIFTQELWFLKRRNHPSPPRSAGSQCRLRRIGVMSHSRLVFLTPKEPRYSVLIAAVLSVERCSSPDDNVWTLAPVTAKRHLLSEIVGQRQIYDRETAVTYRQWTAICSLYDIKISDHRLSETLRWT